MVNEVQMSYKYTRSHKIVKDSESACEYFREGWENMDYCESFWIMCLSSNNEVISTNKISEGGLAGTFVDVRKIMQVALLSNCRSVIVCHNHPSGSLKFSEPDVRISNRIKEACTIMEMSLLDSLVITSDSYISMMDQGIL